MARRVRFVPVGLALLGAVLTVNSVRFIAIGALLLGPLAVDGAHELVATPAKSAAMKTCLVVGKKAIESGADEAVWHIDRRLRPVIGH